MKTILVFLFGRKYTGEVADDQSWEQRHRLITVRARNTAQAHKKISKLKKPEESIYQICRKFRGCQLEQPVWDYFNQILHKS